MDVNPVIFESPPLRLIFAPLLPLLLQSRGTAGAKEVDARVLDPVQGYAAGPGPHLRPAIPGRSKSLQEHAMGADIHGGFVPVPAPPSMSNGTAAWMPSVAPSVASRAPSRPSTAAHSRPSTALAFSRPTSALYTRPTSSSRPATAASARSSTSAFPPGLFAEPPMALVPPPGPPLPAGPPLSVAEQREGRAWESDASQTLPAAANMLVRAATARGPAERRAPSDKARRLRTNPARAEYFVRQQPTIALGSARAYTGGSI
jgi:hypothetical protein